MERLDRIAAAARQAMGGAARGLREAGRRAANSRGVIVGLLLLGVGAWALVKNPPLRRVGHGELGVRSNAMTGGVAQFREGAVLVLPGVHTLRRYPLRDQVWRARGMERAGGPASVQSVEGLSIGIDLSLRWALDPARAAALNLPEDLAHEVVEPALQGSAYPLFARYTVREIFSSKRGEIQQALEAELRRRLAADGIVLRSVQIGKVDLPADYRAGIEQLLAEELASEKMRFTLELKEKQVTEVALQAEADKLRRERAAQAAASEQVIAARAQEEAMKHVLPFKQKQIEQRQLEAEAEKGARIKQAEAAAQARRIEAAGEAESRQKLADAEVYRLEKVGRTTSEQMAREGALITKHPLLIQKTLADKLSDKVQVIIAPPPADGGFIGGNLLGQQARASAAGTAATHHAEAEQ